MGITGFTMPTIYRWVGSEEGRAHSLHAFAKGRYPGSGQARDGAARRPDSTVPSQFEAVRRYAEAFVRKS